MADARTEQPKPTRRLKVLLSAYACEPGKGSEPGAGWHWAIHMAQRHDVTVVTRANNAPVIEAALRTFAGPKPNFIFFDLPLVLQKLKRPPFATKLYYVLWQIAIRWKLRRLLPEFDLIHHVTFNAFRFAGFWWRTGKPVVLGPLGGGQICPWRLLPFFGPLALAEALRSIVVLLSRWDPIHRLNCRTAARLLIANRDTYQRVPARYRPKVEFMLDAAVEVPDAPPHKASNPAACRFIWVGRLEWRKAASLALRAFARARRQNPRLMLTMVGQGPLHRKLQRLARRLELENAVTWLGNIPHQDIAAWLAQSDVFLFTSLRDTSGYVVLEAMAAGLPVITLCHQGVAEMTTPATALRIPIGSPARTVERLAEAMLQLAADPALRARLGNAGFDRVRQCFTWENKAQRMDRIYVAAVEGQLRSEAETRASAERADSRGARALEQNGVAQGIPAVPWVQTTRNAERMWPGDSGSDRPKVLMLAYACDPEGTGEHWLGWGWAEQAASRHRVYLLTTPNARAAVEQHAARLGIVPIFVPVPRPVRWLTEPFGRFGSWWRKIFWVIRATRVAEVWHEQQRFDLVHQTTFHTFRVPFLATCLGIPSVWGPVAGGEFIPMGFYKFLGPLYVPESLRRVFNWAWFAWPPVQQALEQTDVVFVSNHMTMRFFGRRLAGKCRIVPPNAIRPEDESRPVLPRRRDPREPFRLLYVGNCLPTRAMGLAFAALARSGIRDWELTIIGSGLGLKFWQAEARKYGVADRVRFLGRLAHAELEPHYERADVFVFPALRDSGGSALLEAMSKGLPVVCLDWGGPAEIVDAESGVKVPVTTPDETVEAFAAALLRLRNDPQWRLRLGERAAARARRHFTWAAKRQVLEETYQRLLERARKPIREPIEPRATSPGADPERPQR